jgi:hypothetical protein
MERVVWAVHNNVVEHDARQRIYEHLIREFEDEFDASGLHHCLGVDGAFDDAWDVVHGEREDGV